MTDTTTPPTAPLTGKTLASGAVLLASMVAFVAMYTTDLHQTWMAIPAVIGWAAALYGTRPLVARENTSALYFAYGVMAFLIFFLHETYEFHGKMRIFPLIVGWVGVGLSILDILSLTQLRVARLINTVFGSVTSEPADEGRKPAREIACFAAIAAGVVLIWLFGFLIASPLFVAAWMILWGGKSLRHGLYGGVFTFAFIWLLFEGLLRYELYRGEVVLWLIDWIQS